MDELEAKRIFVTGGTGFVGQALVRDLLRTRKNVVLLTRDSRRVPTDLDREVNIVQGDLGTPQSYADALKGCEAVIHCAKADADDPIARAHLDIVACRNLLNSAIRAGVRRFVHLSTISVYGITDYEFADEKSPRKPADDHYTNSKIQIEEDVLQKKDAIEVVVLQPANIYGPAPCWWSHTLINMMRLGKIILVNKGQGLANMVHVADVVQSIILALYGEGIQGECFIISDGKPRTWREYFERLEAIVGHEAMIQLNASEAKELSSRLMNRSFIARVRRGFGRALLNEPLTFPLTDYDIEKYACRTAFSIAKAVQQLHYQPVYDIHTGLKTVAEYETTNSTQRPILRLMSTQSLAPKNL
jgi:nucleoside-diphosphate-sugar epimerase